jgi:hypothetical protein
MTIARNYRVDEGRELDRWTAKTEEEGQTAFWASFSAPAAIPFA